MINNNNKNQFKIDNKIIPLFNIPITMKQNFDIKTNKYSSTEALASLSQQGLGEGLENKNIQAARDKMVNLYSKVLKKYNSNLSNSFNSSNLQKDKGLGDNITKLKLIQSIKKDNNYEINTIYKNYLHLINRYLPYYIFYNSFFKLGLFLPEQVFKPQFYSLKYKNIFTTLNSSPAFNLRESLNSIANGSITNPKIPFISRPGLKDIFIGDLAALYLGEKKENLVKKFFSPSTLMLSNPSYFLPLLPLGKGAEGQGENKLLKKNLNNNKILVDNNFLPLTQFKSDIKENHYLTNNNININKFNNNVLISNIWQEEEVKSLTKKLIEKGDSLNKELNSLILEKKNLINTIKLNNLFYSNNSILAPSQPKSAKGQAAIISGPGPKGEGEVNSVALSSSPIPQRERGLINSPILNQYLKSMSIYNMKKKGILISYNSLINYNFVKGSLGQTNRLIFKVYKLLQASFKSMYCLISKPLFIVTPDKIIIRLFYFLFVPNLLKYKKLAHSSIKQVASASRGNRIGLSNNKSRLIKKQYSKFRKLKKNVRVQLRNLSNIALTKIFANKFKILTLILSKLFKKPVELDLTRLHYPYNDSNILVNLLGIMINKIKLRIIIRRLFEKAVIKNLNKLPLNSNSNLLDQASPVGLEGKNNWKESVNIPAFLSGIKINIGGRLLTQSVVPRQTVKITQRGATQRGKINFLDVARYTRKNKRGAFSITIKSGQNIF